MIEKNSKKFCKTRIVSVVYIILEGNTLALFKLMIHLQNNFGVICQKRHSWFHKIVKRQFYEILDYISIKGVYMYR